MVDITVIMPAFNAAATVEEQLDALARQETSRSWELIVSDNGSTDGTAEIVERHRGQIPQLRVVDSSGYRGAGFARNYAASLANSRLLLFCDADDIVQPKWIEELAAALDVHDAVGGGLDEVTLNGPDSRAMRPPLIPGHLPAGLAGFLPRAVTANLGVNTEVFQTLGGFDEHIPASEDTEFCLRLQVAGYTLGFAPDARVAYRHREDIRANLQQTYAWSRARPLLYLRFRHHGARRQYGMRIAGGTVAFSWYLLAGRRRRLRWLNKAARLAGRVAGSVRYRTLYL